MSMYGRTILAVALTTVIVVLIESYLAWRASNKDQDDKKED